MPHFSSSAAGTTSELIRLWRSRLKASPAKHHDDDDDNPLPPPPPTPPPATTLPPPVEGVLSQPSKMSEAQDSSTAAAVAAFERRQSSDNSGITRQKSEHIDEDRENSAQRDSAPSTPKLESPRREMLASTQKQPPPQPQPQQQQQQQQQQQRPAVGECNLLPVLVERLRSALELSCSASPSCSEDNNSSAGGQQLTGVEDSGVDSCEEDLRLWTSQLNHQQTQALQHKPKLDLKFLEDILLADIHTALARLQDTLKRVDVNTLTRYNASLDSSNKLYLLRLISNLLAKLKVPEEAKITEPESGKFQNFRRRKNDRHTISVSADEVARARLWLTDDSSSESSPRVALEKSRQVDERVVEGAPGGEPTHAEQTSMKSSTFSDKCMKDAINQQQSLQNKKDHVSRRFDNPCKDDIGLSENKERRSSVFYPRHNKFTAKKSKIKRANTIDIPNYLQLKSDSPEQQQNGCFALRRPIDVSDRASVNGAKKAVPLFEPKTDNDRKFLALINKNNNTEANVNSTTSGPFKSFSYRHPATVADKNWQNRFSSIKTNFDRQSDSENEVPQPAKRKTGIVDVRKKFEAPRAVDEVVDGMRMPCGPAKQKQSSFTHAPTSPFQKIERKVESVPPPFVKAGYAPTTSALQAKLKMFDQEAKNKPTPPPTVDKKSENGHQYYSFCKQFAPFAAGGKQDGGKSSVDATKGKLLTNLSKEPDKSPPRKDKAKAFLARQDPEDNRYDFSKQYSYHKPAYEEYRQLDKKPQYNSYLKPENKRFENVAVQTTNESNERRPSEPELINTIADLRDYPVPMPRKQRNSVSVQTTTSPSIVPPIYSQPTKSPNLASPIPPATATSPSLISPIPHPQPTYKPCEPGYYNKPPSYLSDNNYYTTDKNNVYPPYSDQSYAPIEPTATTTHLPISQKLYNEFSKLPDPARDYAVPEIPPYVPPYVEKEGSVPFKPIINVYEEKPNPAEEHIENQELSSDGIVTRYTSAIATVSSMPESPEPSATPYEPVVPRIKEAQPRHFAETTTIAERKSTTTPVDEIQRHNALQQSLIRRMQNEQHQQVPAVRRFSQEIPRKGVRSPPSPTMVGRVCALKALNESHKAQEKIHMFEEKRLNSKQLFRPVNVPSAKLNPPPTMQGSNERSPRRSPIDSSDEYLMSCANKPTRNIVLSKSESWHQLALASKGGLLQPPQPTQQKPPKPKSPSSLRLSKQFEASAAADNMRKMEEKVQQYFQSGGNAHEEKHSKSKSRRNLQSKKTMNSLARSHTMPHLYDDRLFDDAVDVDQAFDSIFKEATRSDNRL